MALPWVRLDNNIAHHDKVLRLIADPAGWRAYAVYTFALGYCSAHGTDGWVPGYALASIHGTPKVARLLEETRLWEPTVRDGQDGWLIRNFVAKQEPAAVSKAKAEARKRKGRKAACARHHQPGCRCWDDSGGDVIHLPKAHP